MIHPLAFGIMGLMKWMYTIMGPFGNYGIVIMILVFLVRILMHPVTKKSQVSMMKMQKLGPKMEEIKKKYANNKAELNKQVMALYKEQGVSPFASMLPMMLQMPIWIALWTAVYTSIDLRGAPFLPFWITDLSVPDALIRFKEITIPLVGWQIDSFNLLPILMGVVMYLQQKLMPHSSSAQTDSQVAQQQKMMMVMMTLMFPIMLYKGPSGVNLYIMSSITAGVIEQMVIRRHIRRKEAEEATGLVSVTSKTGGKVRKKKPKPFFKY
jgi:YidC/Oxa1 family membrane protein insertase